jgi:hypothetical protein
MTSNFCSFLLQAVNGGIVSKYIVAYFGFRHGFPHGGTGLGYGIAA